MNPDTRSLVVSCQADHIATYDEQIAPLLEGFNGSKNLDWYEIANEDHECTSSRQNKDHVRRSIAKFMLDFIERDPTESPTLSRGSSTTSNSNTGSDESQCELIAIHLRLRSPLRRLPGAATGPGYPMRSRGTSDLIAKWASGDGCPGGA